MPAHQVDIYIGKRIRELRQLRGMTQAELGDLTDVKFQQIQKYETGMNRVSGSRLWEIAGALKVEPSYFFPKTIGDTEDRESIVTREHAQLIQTFETLHPAQKTQVLATVRVMNQNGAA